MKFSLQKAQKLYDSGYISSCEVGTTKALQQIHKYILAYTILQAK